MEWKKTPDRKILTWGGLDKSRGSRGEVLAQSVRWSGRHAYSRTGSRQADHTTPQQKPRFVTGFVHPPSQNAPRTRLDSACRLDCDVSRVTLSWLYARYCLLVESTLGNGALCAECVGACTYRHGYGLQSLAIQYHPLPFPSPIPSPSHPLPLSLPLPLPLTLTLTLTPSLFLSLPLSLSLSLSIPFTNPWCLPAFRKHYTEVPAHRLSLPGPKTATKRPGLFTSQKQAREASLVQVHNHNLDQSQNQNQNL
jgi:hypothetical protein